MLRRSLAGVAGLPHPGERSLRLVLTVGTRLQGGTCVSVSSTVSSRLDEVGWGSPVIVYGICIGSDEKYDKYCAPFLQAHVRSEDVLESRQNPSILSAYNGILDEAGRRVDLEALVLLHEDMELRSPDFEMQVRAHLSDPDVAILGAVGGRGVQGIRWFRATERFGRMPDLFNGANDFGGGTNEVDIVDGCILVMSAWAVQHLRFDAATYQGFHAYDADICMQARAAGKKVLVVELDALHHTKGGFGDVARHQKKR